MTDYLKIEATDGVVGELLYACTECDTQFTHPHTLKIHKFTHTRGVEPDVDNIMYTPDLHLCPECNKCFKHIKSLNNHRRKKHGACEEGDLEAVGENDFDNADNEDVGRELDGEEENEAATDLGDPHDEDNVYNHLLKLEPEDNEYMGNEYLENEYIAVKYEREEGELVVNENDDMTYLPGEDCDNGEDEGVTNGFMDTNTVPDASYEGGSKYKYICEECGKLFITSKGQKKHTRIYHNEEHSFFCTECGKGFISKASLTLHETTHGSQRLYECDKCGKMFTKALHLKAHELSHDGDQRHKCTECDKKFTNSFNLKRHQQTHVGQPYTCDLCDKNYARLPLLNKHLRQEHGGEYLDETNGELVVQSAKVYLPPLIKSEKEERQFLCTVCGNVFNKAADLRTHTKVVHRLERPYLCTLCNKRFPQSSHLHVHIRLVHERERPFTCSFCSKTFGQSSHVRMHIRAVHQKERPYPCEKCDKMFVQSAHVKQHYRLAHSDERPFSCEQCNKTFVLKYHMNQHVKLVHNGERPYPCALCEKKFRISSHLKEHLKTAHQQFRADPVVLHMCTVCNTHFQDRNLLMIHMQLHHHLL